MMPLPAPPEVGSTVPVAKQFTGLEQSTRRRKVAFGLAAFGLGTIDQVTPSHDSTNVLSGPDEGKTQPTETHEVGLVHDTSARLKSLPAGSGLGTIDHDMPSHDSTSVSGAMPSEPIPTATQLVALAQLTPVNWSESAPNASALVTIDHVAPSQCSISVRPTGESLAPTAKQLVVLEHATDAMNAAEPEPRSASGSIVHVVPFQAAACIKLPAPPTATHTVVLGHAMLPKDPPTGGIDMRDQCTPSQCSTRGSDPAPVVTYPPTPKQLVAPGQAMSFNPPVGGPAGFALDTTDHEGAAPAGAAYAAVRPATSVIATRIRDTGCTGRAERQPLPRLTTGQIRICPPMKI